MSKTVARLEPNPIVTENIANFMCPKRMFRDDKPIVVLPNSRVDIARTCTGTVGYLNHECLYPLVLVGDCGCGVAALIIDEDAELPDNYQELITQALSEEYSEEDPEEGLGLSFEEYPGDEIDMYIKSCQLITEMVNSGDDDTYLTSSIISPNNVPEPFKTLVMSDRAEGGVDQSGFRNSSVLAYRLKTIPRPLGSLDPLPPPFGRSSL